MAAAAAAAAAPVAVCLLLLLSFASQAAATFSFFPPPSLSYTYYLSWQHWCPQFPFVVADVIQQATAKDRFAAPGLLRAFFHDCFVRGCDASLLLDPVPGQPENEKQSFVNFSIRRLELVDEIKTRLEKVCPGKVSCADILAQASVEAVYRVGGPKISLRMGRRDGKVSLADDVLTFLPPPFLDTDQLIANFQAVGLGAQDVVPLSGGGHTFGQAHCGSVRFRLDPPGDPALSPTHKAYLEKTFPDPTCGGNPFSDTGPAVNLDNTTSDRFDEGYFKSIINGRTAMRSDAALLEGQLKDQVLLYARDRTAFFNAFANSMKRMSELSVKLGSDGEIRRNCRRIN